MYHLKKNIYRNINSSKLNPLKEPKNDIIKNNISEIEKLVSEVGVALPKLNKEKNPNKLPALDKKIGKPVKFEFSIAKIITLNIEGASMKEVEVFFLKAFSHKRILLWFILGIVGYILHQLAGSIELIINLF